MTMMQLQSFASVCIHERTASFFCLISEMEKVTGYYIEDFDPDWFLEHYVKTMKQQIEHGGQMPFALDFLNDIFATGKYKASRLLDIGTGPTIHTVISASRHVKEIHLSDIGARNREILQNWRDGETYCAEILEYVSKKENDGTSLEDRINEIRDKVTRIYEVDLRSSKPLHWSNETYDMIIASLVICTVAKNEEEYILTLRKIMAMLKPGGYLVIIGSFDTTFYKVNNVQFSNPGLGRGAMKNIFITEGLRIVNWRDTEPGKYISYHRKKGLSDETGMFGMIAQIPEDI